MSHRHTGSNSRAAEKVSGGIGGRQPTIWENAEKAGLAMASPLFLSVEDVIEIHADQIQRYGGSLGIRDVGLLHSALGMPEAGIGDQYLHAGLFEMGAAYLYHIVQNHPFIDGNKRTGAMAAFVFLKLNGFTLVADESVFETLVLQAAQGQTGKDGIAKFFRENAKS